MVNWDPGTGSAISDLEVEQRWVEDTLYSIDYPLESGAGSVTVATVRPETMLADTAIAVNPDDERYTRLVGEAADPADRRPPAADHRRPPRGPGVRHRRAEDHARPRPQRLRHRPQARPRRGQRDRRGRPHVGRGRRAVRGHDRGGRPPRGGGGAARGRLHLGHPALRARRAPLPPLGPADRAADLAAVVLRRQAAGRPGHRSGARRHACASTPRSRGPASTWTGWRTSGPGASRASCGGATRSRSGTAARSATWGSRRPRARAGSATPTCSTPGSRRRCGRSRRWAGPSRPTSCGPSTRPTSSRPRGTSSTSGSPG